MLGEAGGASCAARVVLLSKEQLHLAIEIRLVRFRVAKKHRAAAENVPRSFDARYVGQDRSHCHGQRIVWNQIKWEAWAWLACEQHGIDFVTQLLRDKRITDHNIQDE